MRKREVIDKTKISIFLSKRSLGYNIFSLLENWTLTHTRNNYMKDLSVPFYLYSTQNIFTCIKTQCNCFPLVKPTRAVHTIVRDLYYRIFTDPH